MKMQPASMAIPSHNAACKRNEMGATGASQMIAGSGGRTSCWLRKSNWPCCSVERRRERARGSSTFSDFTGAGWSAARARIESRSVRVVKRFEWDDALIDQRLREQRLLRRFDGGGNRSGRLRNFLRHYAKIVSSGSRAGNREASSGQIAGAWCAHAGRNADSDVLLPGPRYRNAGRSYEFLANQIRFHFIAARRPTCYGFRLISFFRACSRVQQSPLPTAWPTSPVQVSIRNGGFCLEHSLLRLSFALLLVLTPVISWAQTGFTGPASKDQTEFHADTQVSEGSVRHLHGHAEIRTAVMLITADEMDYDEDTGWVNARGHVTLEHFLTQDHLKADHAKYNIKTHNGQFYDVSGTSPAKAVAALGILTTTNPFYFEAKSADRIDDRYVLHDGFMTDCKVPNAWWTFHAPTFDIIPNDRAVGRNAIFRLKGIPVFYLPYFYRPLGKNPRSSGFLTPQIGNSSLFGFMIGAGYYWAMSPSYDMTIRGNYFTSRGPALLYDFRGKPNEVTDFDFSLYGVDDRGVRSGKTTLKEGGVDFQLRATTELASFTGHVDYSYLSSLVFREVFAYSFTTALLNEVDSVGFLQRRYDSDQYTLTFAAQRNQTFEALTFNGTKSNQVLLDKLPSVEFNGRERQISDGPLPAWFAFDTSASALSREDQAGQETAAGPPADVFQTGMYGRMDMRPHVMTNFSFAGFSLTPGLTAELTDYTNSYLANTTTYQAFNCAGIEYCPVVTEAMSGTNLFRKDADFTMDLRTPALERIYSPPKWLHLGTKLKHVIEAEAQYEYVTGVNQFQHVIHYDETDILSNTNQLTLRLTNRVYRKEKSGNATEVFSWEIAQARYFDPTFGGAVIAGTANSAIPGYRNVVYWSADLTPIPFLNGPRTYSPIVSSMQLFPYNFFSVDWHTDYDPLRHAFVDQTYSTSFRYKTYFASLGEMAITTDPLLVPQANQVILGGGYGSSTRKGWNFTGNLMRDVRLSRDTLEGVQAVYNTDCCGFSFRYQRINFGARQDENQVLFSFSLANIGTFGSLQRGQTRF